MRSPSPATVVCVAVSWLAVAGCTGQGGQSVPTVERVGNRPITVADVESVEMRLNHLQSISEHVVARCMQMRGWPQLRKAAGRVRAGIGVAVHSPVVVHRLELGPGTLAEARRYGVVGVELAFDESESAGVISRDPRFNRALASCERSFPWQRRARTLVTRAQVTLDELRRAFLAMVEPDIGNLLAERLTCVRENGYPMLDADRFLRLPIDEGLRSVGVRPGRFEGGRRPIPRIAKGAVTIVPPRTVRGYTPTPAEVAFAVAYVRCGRAMGFDARLACIQDRARGSILEAWDGRIRELQNRFDALERVVAASP